MRESMVLGATTEGPSPKLWGSCPWTAIKEGTRRGTYLFDDFENMPDLSSLTTASNLNKYGGFTVASAFIKQVPDKPRGELQIGTNAADNVEAWMNTGGNVGGFMQFIDQQGLTSGLADELWFEIRFKLNEVATGNHFIGFCEDGITQTAGNNIISQSNAMHATKDWLGFYTLLANPATLNFSYKVNGVTQVTAVTVKTTMVAATYYKVGFKFSPLGRKDRAMTIFLDNAPISTYVTQTQMHASAFPSTQALEFMAGVMASSAAHILTLDWIRIATLALS